MSAATAAATVAEALAAAADALAAAGCDSARLDAELLLADALGADRAGLAAHPEGDVAPEAARRFGGMVRRRVAREPVAYILGRKGFRGIELAVDRRVLIPRPETELLVEVALELAPATVLDAGTGSGAVALAIADELPGTSLVATDLSASALALAGENSTRLELAQRVELGPGTLPRGRDFDLVCANLPYVRDDEWDALAPEITRWEPRDALVAGSTGLEAIEMLLASIVAGSGDISAIALEIGEGQAPIVAKLVERAGFAETESRRDLAGIDRVVVGRQ